MSSAARSMSSSVISRWVTARTTFGWIVAERPTPASRRRARAAAAVEPERLEVDLDEVRLDPLEVDREARLRERLGEPPRAGVILREALDVVVERVDAGRRDDTRLAHRAAEEVLLPPGALDEVPRAREQGAERTAEAFREAERHRVEAGGDRRRLDAERRRGVEEAGAVEMNRQPELARGGDDVVELASGQTRPPAMLCVFSSERTATRWSAIFVLGAAASRICSEVMRPPVPGSPSVIEPGMGGRASVLVDEDVRVLLGEEHVARTAWSFRAIWFAIVAVGTKSAASCPSNSRDPDLELGDRRVLALLLVADGGLGDGAAHARRGLRDGVGAEVDHARDATVRAWISRYWSRRSPSAASPLPRAPGVGVDGARRGVVRRHDDAPEGAPAALAEAVPFSTLEVVAEREARTAR